MPNSTDPEKALIYARVSSDEQTKNYSLPTQIAGARKYAADHGLVVVGEYTEGFTGGEFDRPELDKLRQAIKDGAAKTVIVYCLDRFARKLLYQLMIEDELKRLGADVRYVLVDYDDSPDGILMKQISASISEYERARIKERLNRGKAGRISAGYPLPTRFIPFGYRYVSLGPGRGAYEIDPEEAGIVRQVFDWYITDRLSTAAIATRLTAAGIDSPGDKTASKTRHGRGVWSNATVYNMLKRPIYKGVFIWGRTRRNEQRKLEARPPDAWKTVDVPAIVSVETWEAAQAQMARNRTLSRRNTRHDYLMRGRLRCADCGQNFHCDRVKQKFSYYLCGGMRPWFSPRNDATSCKRPLNQPRLDAEIWAQICALLKDPAELERRRAAIAQATAGQHEAKRRELDDHARKLAEIDGRTLRLVELYELRKIDAEVLEQRNAALQEQRQKLRRQMADLRAGLAGQANTEQAFDRLRDYAERVRGRVDGMTTIERRGVIDDLDIYALVKRGATAEDDEIVITFG